MSGVWWLVGALLTQNLSKLPRGYNPLAWIMERHHYTHAFLQIQFSLRRKWSTSNAWSMRRRAVNCTLRQSTSVHTCIMKLYQMEISSVLFSLSPVSCLWQYTAGHVLTLCRCQPWHNDNIKLCHPAPGTWEYDDPSIMYSACIYIFTPFTTLLRLSAATMSWSFRTFVNKGNVRIIITQMLEWKQRSRWIHAHVSRFLFIVLWIIKRLTPPKYQSH